MVLGGCAVAEVWAYQRWQQVVVALVELAVAMDGWLVPGLLIATLHKIILYLCLQLQCQFLSPLESNSCEYNTLVWLNADQCMHIEENKRGYAHMCVL